MRRKFQEQDSINKQLELIAILTLVTKLLHKPAELGYMANLLDLAEVMNEKPIQVEALIHGVILLTLALGLPLAPILPMALLSLSFGAIFGSVCALVIAFPLAGVAFLLGAVSMFEDAYKAYTKMDLCTEKTHELAKSIDHDNYVTANSFSFRYFKDIEPVIEEIPLYPQELPLGAHQG